MFGLADEVLVIKKRNAAPLLDSVAIKVITIML